MPRVIVEQSHQRSASEQHVEIVERKGLGHPDSICDAVANRASVVLCGEYQKSCGRILHHNLDKAMLVAGLSTPAPGGGRIHKPMRMILGDRAVSLHDGLTIDVPAIVTETAKDWIRQNLRFVDPDRHIRFQSVIEAGSPELRGLFNEDRARANDTSAAVGFAPLSPVESAVLNLEQHLNSSEFKTLFPETGEDVKVMAVRNGEDLHFTVAVAFVDRFVTSRRFYFQRKEQVVEHLREHLRSLDLPFSNTRIDLNALDDPSDSSNGMYLTVLGISAEGADSGQVGRGNRVSGLISINRPESIEAHAGKNPVSHVGKIYSYFAHHVAGEIYSKVRGICEVYVSLCGQIGKPIDEPLISSIKVILEPGASISDVEKPAALLLSEELAQIADFQRLLTSEDFYASWEKAPCSQLRNQNHSRFQRTCLP